MEDESYDRLESLGEWRAEIGDPEPWDDSFWEGVLDRADNERKRRREAGIPNPYLPETEPVGTRCGASFPTGAVCILRASHAGGHYFRTIPAREEQLCT